MFMVKKSRHLSKQHNSIKKNLDPLLKICLQKKVEVGQESDRVECRFELDPGCTALRIRTGV